MLICATRFGSSAPCAPRRAHVYGMQHAWARLARLAARHAFAHPTTLGAAGEDGGLRRAGKQRGYGIDRRA